MFCCRLVGAKSGGGVGQCHIELGAGGIGKKSASAIGEKDMTRG